MWILWLKDVGLMEPPSHYCHVTSYLRTCHSWMIEDEVIHCTNNQSPIEIVALCGLLSYLPSFLSTPILTLYPEPGPHHFSLATLFHCPDASPSRQTSGAQPLACSPCVWSTGQMQSPGWDALDMEGCLREKSLNPSSHDLPPSHPDLHSCLLDLPPSHLSSCPSLFLTLLSGLY